MYALGHDIHLGFAEAKITSDKSPGWIWVSCVSGEYSNIFILCSFFSYKKLEFWNIFLWPSSYQKKKKKKEGRSPWISTFQRIFIFQNSSDWL